MIQLKALKVKKNICSLELQEPGCNASLEHINYVGLEKVATTTQVLKR